MRALLWKTIDSLGRSYWFIPTVMAIGATVLAVTMVSLDHFFGTGWLHSVPWVYAYEADGARTLLQTIAGSMITVAGVTFSITIAAVATTTTQFGPRLMTNFMTDRGNQITLGTFVATFLYCILVLTTVYGGDESDAGAFVPTFAVLGSLVMAILSLGVLIYFIHHIPENIHVSKMIANVGHNLSQRIDALYPEHIGHPPQYPEHFLPETGDMPLPNEDVFAISAGRAGYIQNVEGAQLLRAASSRGLVFWLVSRPGMFATEHSPLVLAKPASLVDSATIGDVRAAFILGARRTPSQDVLFLVDQLAEVAIRALSPGINDPLTACYAIDWLAAGIEQIAGRNPPGKYRFDADGQLRVVAEPLTFDRLADAAFTQIRPHAQKDRIAALHLLHTIVQLIRGMHTEDQRQRMQRYFDELIAGCSTDLTHPADREAIRRISEDENLRRGRRPRANIGERAHPIPECTDTDSL